MRGKGCSRISLDDIHRITPACAGKSFSSSFFAFSDRDHPRVCGEKARLCATPHNAGGSPPRVRGKGRDGNAAPPKTGITPACAGKRLMLCRCLRSCGDHPRVCGEKVIPCTPGLHIQGSPPRVRGKGLCRPAGAHAGGITPACAGKRKRAGTAAAMGGDHPRVCGEKLGSSCGA